VTCRDRAPRVERSGTVGAFVDANGLRIHYGRLGDEAADPIVLLHGRADSGACWSRVARHLAARFRVLTPDARGHGLTAGPVAGTTADMLADDLAAFLRALRIARPILFGHSMGATTAMLLAAASRDVPGTLVLEDPPLRDEPDARDVAERIAEGEAERRMPVDERVRAGEREHPTWTREDLRPWAESKRQADPAVFAIDWPLDWRSIVSRVACPVLLVSGDPERGAIVTPATAADVERLASRAEVVRIDGAGHSIHRDRFGPTMEAVDAFLAGLPAPAPDPSARIGGT
jgi:pimeloyl-ACP methyl ester carboxylesterase